MGTSRKTSKRRTLSAAGLLFAIIATVVAVMAPPALAIPPGYSVNGIDVYEDNGAVNWTAAYDGGVRFGWAKATEGTSHVDSRYATNYTNARNAKVILGAYAFGRPDNGDAKAQADFLVDKAKYASDGLSLPPQLDIEWPYWTKDAPIYPCYGLSESAMVSWIRTFVDEVKARTGRDAAIYTNTNWWKSCTGNNASFGANPLEIANYDSSLGALPAGWSRTTAWQYNCSDSVSGTTDAVCQTAFNGSLDDLAAFARGEGGGTQPPQKGTQLVYTGAGSVSNGSAARLSAKLTDEDGKTVGDRSVGFALGTGDSEQTCKGTTNAEGEAACTVDAVKQPLTEDATVPVTAAFTGDDAYKPSKTSAKVKLEYVSGRSFGLSANLPLLVLPISIKPTPDTGDVRTADATTKAPPCAQTVNTLLLSAGTLCAKVSTETSPTGVTSTASVEKAQIGLLGLPVLGLSGVKATSRSTCGSQTGSVDLTLTVAGAPVNVGDTPNLNVDLGVVGTKLVVNEQIKNSDGGLTVNAAHLTAPGGIDVTIASSATSAHNCT